MAVSSMKELLEAGVHFGHHTRKWNPKMKAYIYGERNDIYIIDLHKTRKKLEEAYEQVRQMAFNGNTFLFVGTKKQAQDSIREAAGSCGQHYVNHRWLGGMLTNWPTMQTRIDRLNQLDKMQEDGTMDKLPKKESARLLEERAKLDQTLGGIRSMSGLPSCIFIVDCKKEHIAIREAHRLEIPIVAVVDTNCDPDEVTHVIPGNDDAIRAVKLMSLQMAEAINEGRGMAQSAMEQRADAAMQGAVGGAVHIGEGGRIEYVGAPTVELPPVDTGEADGAASDGAASDGAAIEGTLDEPGAAADGAAADGAAANGDATAGAGGGTVGGSIGGLQSFARTSVMGGSDRGGIESGASPSAVNQIGASQHDSALDVGPQNASTDGTAVAMSATSTQDAAASTQNAPGEAGDTSDPDSATQRSGDTGYDPTRVTVEEVEAGGDAVGARAPQIITEENSDEGRSERAVGAETPSQGTLG